ncbi:MAG: ATP-binding protein [Halobacteriales archaeon]
MAINLALLGYVAAFGAAAFICFGSLPRASQIVDDDTRRGVVWLLLASGGWATAHVGFLLVPTVGLKTAFYMIGLVVGLGAVGPWLYFCSAYTGRSLHRNPAIRRTAVAVFLAVILVKVTNPIHGLYFTGELVTTPFPHLAIESGLLHWLAMGLAYALATVGYFMLLELFLQVNYDTKPFVALVSITGLPIFLDVMGLASPWLIDITYEPLGVAVFAVGMFYVYIDQFQAIRIAGGRDDPVLVLTDEGTLRDYNMAAAAMFSELADNDVLGDAFADVLPDVAAAADSGQSVITLQRDGGTRYYQMADNPFGADQAQLGRMLTFTDVTHRERYRRELERQNERLEQFANMVSHDLRNPLNVAEGRLDLARQATDNEHLEAVEGALDRMGELIDDLLKLARQGQPIDEMEPVQLANLVETCWDLVETAEAELVMEEALTFEADPERVQQLLENLLRNAIDHVGSDVTIRVGRIEGEQGFFVADDGPGIPGEDREDVFESGYTTDTDGTGFGLAIVKEIADAHEWTITVTESRDGGARFEVTNLDVAS